MNTEKILEQLYVSRQKESKRRWFGPEAQHVVRRGTWALVASSIFISAWIIAHISYFNKLTVMETTIHAARAQIQAQEQRRYHTRVALTNIAASYSVYEKRLLTGIVELRTGLPPGTFPAGAIGPDGTPVAPAEPAAGTQPAEKPPTPPVPPAKRPGQPAAPLAQAPGVDAKSMKDLLGQLKVIAEQYPELKLTQNLQQLSASVIESEIEIAHRIMTYNDAVNQYSSVVQTFPGVVFARLSGFKDYDFYQPDGKKLEFDGAAEF